MSFDPIPSAGDAFYARALERIERFMLALGMAAPFVLAVSFGWRYAVGFLVGAGLAYLNFRWLKKAVAAIAELTVRSGARPSGRGIVHRFLLRYFLMAVLMFVILTVSRASLYGLFAGLFLPVAAILCEAGYEVYAALIRGI
jgi:glycerol uptake facilitator-like aquaporin